MSLKVLADKIIARNSTRNNRATGTEGVRNFTPVFDDEKLRDIAQTDDGIIWSETEISEAIESRESRRARVLTILATNPNLRRAYLVEPDAYPSAASVFIADQDKSFELLIPRKWFDPFAMAELVRTWVSKTK